MFKKFWNKKTICLGLMATMITGLSVTLIAPTAANICKELNLAGLSLSMDKYTASTNSSIIASTVTTSAVTAAAADAKPEKEEKRDAGKENKKKKVTVKKQFKNKAISIAKDYVNIRKKANTNSKVLGKLYRGSASNVISTKKGWAKIQSGDVTGYIKESYLAVGPDAQNVAEKFGRKLVSVKKDVVTLNVREEKSTDATILSQIPEEESYEVANECKNWVKIVIDEDTKGFVSKEYVNVRIRFKRAVSIKEERAERARERASKLAQQRRLTELESSGSSRSSSSSRASGSSSSSGSSSNGSSAKATGSTGSDIAKYALNFVGNPYRMGGTSLTGGADCSGFVQSIYAQYGYGIPRTSREQSTYGQSIRLSSVQPGDLIFYKHGSTVGHVAMYIGGGKVVHAASTNQGIITSSMNYNQPYCARRIV